MTIAKFAKAREAMPAPVKDTDAYKYKYADLEQVKGIVEPALREQGLEVIQYQEKGYLHTRIIDVESGEIAIEDIRNLLVDGTDQQRGSSETYQRRYALLTVCGLAPTDDDGAAASQSAPKATKTHQGGQGAPDGLSAAKKRLWDAVQAYAERSGGDAKALADGTKKRSDHEETIEWYERVAEEFASA